MLVSVLRQPERGGDCTNGGITTRYYKFVVTGPEMPEIFAPSSDAPELRIDMYQDYARLKVVHDPDKNTDGLVGGMAGGNFVTTSDSRWRTSYNPNGYPLPVHDRYETQELYDILSR